jgi:dolichyl-diphosphooligosaccharide--protein glycosyltransferase
MNTPGKRNPAGDGDTGRRPRTLAVFLILLGLALAARCYNHSAVFVGKKVFLRGVDSYYHMRRIRLAIRDFPRVPGFDYYVNYPHGAILHWPQGYDLLFAAAGRSLLGPDPPASKIESIAAWIVPLLGGLTVLLLWGLGREQLDFKTGSFAALLFALMPAHVYASELGRVDHHVMEPLGSIGIFWLFMKALRRRTFPGTLLWAGLAGLCHTLLLLCWPGGIMFLAIPLLFGFWETWRLAESGKTGPEIGTAVSTFLASAALTGLVLPFAGPYGGALRFSYLYLSWFQPALAAGLLAAFLPFARLAHLCRRHRAWARLLPVLYLPCLLLLGLALLTFAPGLRTTLRDGLEYLTRKEPVIGGVIESRSLFFPRFRGDLLARLFGLFVYSFPPLALLLGAGARGADEKSRALRFFLVWSLVLAGFVLLQTTRFSWSFAPPLAIVSAAGLTRLLRRVARLKRGSRRLFSGLVLVTAFSLALLPALAGLLPRGDIGGPAGFLPVYEALVWVRKNTPAPGHLWRPTRKPSYGLLAEKDLGHWINYIAQRPNVANPFGQAPLHIEAVKETYRFFTATKERDALSITDSANARYVLVIPNPAHLPAWASVLKGRADLVSFREGVTPCPAYFRLLSTRLHIADGACLLLGDEIIPALEHFRLLYESHGHIRVFRHAGSYSKVFQVVRGGRIVGRTRPGALVRLRIKIETNTGRSFYYRSRKMAGPDGAFAFSVPYPTKGTGHAPRAVRPPRARPSPIVRSLGPYRLRAAGRSAEVRFSEREILAGETRILHLR